jgi:hypothetical protein
VSPYLNEYLPAKHLVIFEGVFPPAHINPGGHIFLGFENEFVPKEQ